MIQNALKRLHISFFFTNGYNLNKLPPIKALSSLPKNPWAAMGIDLRGPGPSGEKRKSLDDSDKQLLDDEIENPRKKSNMSEDDGIMFDMETESVNEIELAQMKIQSLLPYLQWI